MKMADPKVQHKANGEDAEEIVDLSDKTIYTLLRREDKASDSFVDLVLKIMDGEGPRPMRNLRPAQKTRNGADRFYLEHQAEYEARVEQSSDRISRVLNHNSAYPKMHDELNKRESTAKPAAYSTNENMVPSTNSDANCRVCVKLKKPVELGGRRKRSKPRHKRNDRKKPNLRAIRSKISKSKRSSQSRQQSRLYKLSKIRLNKGCQCTCYYIPTETKTVSTFNDDFLSVLQQDAMPLPSANNFVRTDNIESIHMSSPIQESNKASIKSSKSDIDSGNRETPRTRNTSAPSTSSYNSYLSMDHEPMIE